MRSKLKQKNVPKSHKNYLTCKSPSFSNTHNSLNNLPNIIN